MRKNKLEKELHEAKQALRRGMYARMGYTFLIEELIKNHPNPKAAFNDTIRNFPVFKEEIADLADLLELDLCTDD